MKLENLGNNMTLLKLPRGVEIFFSYNTPVAGYKPVTGWFKTGVKYSNTTTKHINIYLTGVVNSDVSLVNQEDINELLGE